MLTKEKLVDECREIFNDICLVGDTTMARFIGIHEDAADFYYTCKTIKGNIINHSAVGHIVSLRGIYPRYEYLDNIFTINGSPPESEFCYTTASDEENKLTYGVDYMLYICDKDETEAD